MQTAVSLFTQFWRRERQFTVSWAADLYRSVLVILGIIAVGGILRYGEIIEWIDADEARLIRKFHLAVGVGAVLLVGYIFLGKLWAEHRKDISKVKKTGNK